MTATVMGDGCRLAYWVSGKADGPAVILSNPLGSDHTIWDRQLAALAPHFRSLPGGTYSVRVIVRDARGEALATSEKQATIVGRDGLR